MNKIIYFLIGVILVIVGFFTRSIEIRFHHNDLEIFGWLGTIFGTIGGVIMGLNTKGAIRYILEETRTKRIAKAIKKDLGLIK